MLILTPVRIQRGDAVRAKLAELDLSQADLEDAVAWARTRLAEPRAAYAGKPPPRTNKTAARKTTALPSKSRPKP